MPAYSSHGFSTDTETVCTSAVCIILWQGSLAFRDAGPRTTLRAQESEASYASLVFPRATAMFTNKGVGEMTCTGQ